MHGSSRIAAAASLALVFPITAQADEHPGNLWDTTSQMTMVGVPMPAMPPKDAALQEKNGLNHRRRRRARPAAD